MSCRHCRAAQRPPVEFVNHLARIWMIMAGRGMGKTRAGAEWLAHKVEAAPDTEWAVVARTTEDIRKTCFEGRSGLLRALGWDRNDPRYNKTSLTARLNNGAIIHSFSAEEPSSVHGPNLSGVWLDEIGKWKNREMWDSLSFAIREGDAQTVATTTPQQSSLVKEFAGRTDGSVVKTVGSMFDNAANLSPAFVSEMEHRWKGTRREKQELHGQLLEDVPGALWAAGTIESTRAVLID